MNRQKSRRPDPVERRIEAALDLGDFIGYRGSFQFASELDQVAREIAGLIRSDPKRAVLLYELFLGGAQQKAEEIDDSDGMFGDFVGELFCNWVRARQAAGAESEETTDIILAKMDEDDYGFLYQIERQLVKALDREGRTSFERHVVRRFEQAADEERSGRSKTGSSLHWANALRALYVEQRAMDKYMSLCERTEIHAGDCAAIARMMQARRRLADALAWIERGITLQEQSGHHAGADLRDMKRALLVKSGKPQDALQSAWSEFQNDPNRFTYEVLMRYAPKRDAGVWREKAMTIAERSGDLAAVIELWLQTGEIDRLVARLRPCSDTELESLSHYATEPAAGRLAKKHPDIAARLYRALGMRIVNSRKSRYYAAALQHFEQARDCYAGAGLDEAWNALVSQVSRDHHRKSAFIAGFERIVRGAGRSTESFADRARKQWSSGSRRS